MRKIIGEILALLWKVFRLVLWKWLKPILGKLIVYAVLGVGFLALVIVILTRL